VPDHTHLLVRIAPKMSTEECALALLNNGQHFVGQHAPQSLIQAKIEQLWQASAYAGTTGKVRVGWTLTIPQLPLGGFERVAAAGVGWTLTIPQLPLGGFRRSKKAIRYSIRKAI
jgi:nitrogen fixation protein